DDGDEERVPEPVGERGLGEEILEVLQRGIERPERRVVDGAPRAVQLGVGTDGRDQHPVERKQRADDEDRQRNVEVHPPLPRPFYDHLPTAPAPVERRVACPRSAWHRHARCHAASSLRRYRNCTQTTMKRTGSMKREMAAPSPRRPVATPT